jgi:hypothetical protein
MSVSLEHQVGSGMLQAKGPNRLAAGHEVEDMSSEGFILSYARTDKEEGIKYQWSK